MSVIEARHLAAGTRLECDVCIIGSGPAGLTVASVLAASRLRVLLLESGGMAPTASAQDLNDLDVIGHPLRRDFVNRVRLFGGTSSLWRGRCMMLSPRDLARRDWVADSGWPLDYDELVPYCERAVGLLGLPPISNFRPEHWSAALGDEERAIVAADPFRPVVALFGRRPLRFADAFGTLFARSRTVDLVLDLTATEIRLEDCGRAVASLRAARPDGSPVTVVGKVFVLAGGGIENARLLLASRRQQPAGVGNGHDNVGRYFMDHPRSVWGRVVLNREADLARLTGFPASWGKGQIGLSLSPEVQEREGLLNSYLTFETSYSDRGARGYGSLVGIVKNRLLARHGAAAAKSPANIALARYIYHLSPMELLPWRLYRLLAALRRRPRRDVVLVNFAEQPPRRESRMLLRVEVDRFGVPLAALDWRVGEAEAWSIRRLHEHLAGHLREHGLGTLEYATGDGAGPTFTDASHHLGTTRMSASPRTGVVDADCQVHGLANLFVSGGSVFPTGGHANPMLTSVALALRLGDTLRRTVGERLA